MLSTGHQSVPSPLITEGVMAGGYLLVLLCSVVKVTHRSSPVPCYSRTSRQVDFSHQCSSEVGQPTWAVYQSGCKTAGIGGAKKELYIIMYNYVNFRMKFLVKCDYFQFKRRIYPKRLTLNSDRWQSSNHGSDLLLKGISLCLSGIEPNSLLVGSPTPSPLYCLTLKMK